MEKLKNWFSVENNVNLIRDFLFVFALFAALLLGVYMSIPRVHAAEVAASIQLPELPAYTHEDPYQDEYVDHQLILYAHDSYYAVLYSTSPSVSEVCLYKHGQVTNGRSSIYFGTLTQLRQIDVYQLVDDSWSTVIDYPLPGNNGTTSSAFGIYFTSAEYSDAVTNQTMLVHSDIPVSASLDGTTHALPSDKYTVTFGDSVVLPDAGESTDPTIPTDPTPPIVPPADTDGDAKISFTEAISFMTASTFTIATAFALFCMNNFIILAGIALVIIGYALSKAKDSMRGV